MTSTATHYETLGVSPGADLDAIKRTYRKLAQLYHPDVNPDPAAAEKLKGINDAYEVLSDNGKRREYDAELRLGAAGFVPRSGGTSSNSGRSGSGGWSSERPDNGAGRAPGDAETGSWTGAGGPVGATFVYGQSPSATPERDNGRPVSGPAPVSARQARVRAWRTSGRGVNPFWFVPVAMTLLAAVPGCAWLEAHLFTTVRAPEGVEISALSLVVMFIVAVLLYIPWNARAQWKPFPAAEQAAVYTAVAVLLPFGWRGVGVLLLLLPVYLFVVVRWEKIRRRRGSGDDALAPKR